MTFLEIAVLRFFHKQPLAARIYNLPSFFLFRYKTLMQ